MWLMLLLKLLLMLLMLSSGGSSACSSSLGGRKSELHLSISRRYTGRNERCCTINKLFVDVDALMRMALNVFNIHCILLAVVVSLTYIIGSR